MEHSLFIHRLGVKDSAKDVEREREKQKAEKE